MKMNFSDSVKTVQYDFIEVILNSSGLMELFSVFSNFGVQKKSETGFEGDKRKANCS